jgi:RNA-directed DNA polymerase
VSLQSQIAADLFLSAQYVSVVTRTASRRYKEYTISKRSGGLRTIFHPSRELKALQRWLLAKVISQWSVHNSASAYREGRGVKDNAAAHRSQPFILKLDFDTFFPSISVSDVKSFLEAGPAAAMQWGPRDIWTFNSLVCRNGQLTIGAPTSPALSNVLCFELDSRLSSWAAERDITYTRYADDITFSCGTPGRLKDAELFVEGTLKALQIPRGLNLNRAKTRHLSRKNRRVVTGLVLTPEGQLSLGRKIKRRLRSLIHSYGKLSATERRSLAGLLSYAIGIEPDLLNRLIIKFGPAVVEQARRAADES